MRLERILVAGVSMKRFIIGIAVTCSLVGCGVSQQQEVQMGQEYAQQINAQLPIIQDPEVNRYINVLGDSISRLTRRKDLDWHFFIVDSKEVNAFAVPGGFIYVNRGLIERTQRMDQLAGVLGHESVGLPATGDVALTSGTAGAVLSTVTCATAVVLLPALSTATACTSCDGVSVPR